MVFIWYLYGIYMVFTTYQERLTTEHEVYSSSLLKRL